MFTKIIISKGITPTQIAPMKNLKKTSKQQCTSKKHNDFFPGWSLCSPHFFPLEWAFLLRKVGPCAGKDAAGDADVGLAHRQGASRKNIGEGLTGDKKGNPRGN